MSAITQVDISRSIAFFRPLLILLICLVHAPYIAGYGADVVTLDNLSTLLGTFIKDTFSRAAVPLLSVISGYLACLSYSKHGYIRLIQKKILRVFIPFVAANFCLYIALYGAYLFVQYPSWAASLIDHTLIDRIKMIFGINRLPVNAPTYFLRDLLLLMVAVPLIHRLINRPTLALLCLIMAFVLFLYTPFLHIFGYGIFYRSDSIFYFVIGYIAGFYSLLNGLVVANAKVKLVLSFILMLLLSCLAVVGLIIYRPSLELFAALKPLFGVLILPIFVFLAAVLAKNSGFLNAKSWVRLERYSFSIFLLHYPLSIIFSYLMDQWGGQISSLSSVYKQVMVLILYLFFVVVVSGVLWELKSKVMRNVYLLVRN